MMHTIKNLIFYLFVVVALFLHDCRAADDTPVGIWKTYDQNKLRSIVQLWIDKDGYLNGNLLRVFFFENEKPTMLCERCGGPHANMPLVGLNFIWGMQGEGKYWSGGSILDPATGSYFRCKMVLKDDGQVLDVNAYWLFPLFGKTYKWERVK